MKGESRTERATPKKRRDARKKGQSVRAVELPQAASLVAAVVLLPVVLPSVGRRFAAGMSTLFEADAIVDPTSATTALGSLTALVVAGLAPLLGGVAIVSVVSQLAVTGAPNPYKLKPRLKNLDPRQGFKRIASAQALWDLLKTILKLGALALITFLVWQAAVPSMIKGPAPLTSGLGELGGALRSLFVQVAAVGVVIGIGDAAWGRWKYNRDQRMSKQDVKDEHKQQEGDPTIRAEIRRQQQKLSRNRMLAAVSGADVVVTNPTHYAVALEYDQDKMGAPVMIAKGADLVAKRIRDLAKENGIPIVSNPPLARALYAIDVGREVPEEQYKAVAEVIGYVMRLDGELRSSRRREETARADRRRTVH